MKSTLDSYGKKLADSVSPRQWILFALLIAVPLLFTCGHIYFSGKSFSSDFGDYVQLGLETVALGVIGLYLLVIIAERSRIIEGLGESEQLYRQLFDVAPEPMIVHRQGKILFTNNAAARAVGVKSAQDLVGKAVFDFLPSSSHSMAQERFDLVERMNSPAPLIEIAFLRMDGASAYGEVAAVPTTFEGEPAILSIGRDITERRHAQEALKESEKKYRLLVENAHDIIYMTDQNGIFMLFNSVGLRTTGYSHDEIVHKHYLDLIHPDYKKEVERFYGVQFVKRIPDTYYELPIITKSGETVWIGQKVHLIIEGDAVGGFQAICRDITDRKMAEEALRESEERYRAVFDNAAVGINLSDSEGRFIQVNSASARILGYTQAELEGMTFFDVTHRDDLEASNGHFLSLVQGKEESYRLEKRYVRKDGEIVWVDVSVSAIHEAKGRHAATLAVVVDITERKRSEQERENLKGQLLRAQKMEAIGTLTEGISHEFNNLLTIVSGYTELLLADKVSHDPEYPDLQKIASACRRGADLVQKLRIFGRKADYEFRPLNLNHEVQETVKLVSKSMPKMIEIQCNLAEGLRAVSADSAQIGQMIINLALNGQDAMPEGGKLILETGNVTLDEAYCSSHVGAKPGNYVQLTVTDSGHGMGETTMQRIFEPFYTTRGLAQRSGMGLAVVHGIVENHGGHMSCESNLGSGTTFKIYLPALAPEAAVMDFEAEAAVMGGSETILLTDDEELITDLGKRILTRAGYTVLVASNGRQAADLYREKQGSIAMVILDLIMPGMGGKQCLREILAMDPRAKVLIASGHADMANKQLYIEAGAKGFVSKPFTLTQLLAEVRKVLDAAVS